MGVLEKGFVLSINGGCESLANVLWQEEPILRLESHSSPLSWPPQSLSENSPHSVWTLGPIC